MANCGEYGDSHSCALPQGHKGNHGCDCWECEEQSSTDASSAGVALDSASVLDLAMMIRAKAEVIANATVEADMHAAVDQIAAGVDRMRAIL